MAENTKIEWADHTFNPWEGCTKVGPGCDNCYAEARNHRFGGNNWGPGVPRRLTSVANWAKPIKWNREAEAKGIRPRVFCASLADWLDNEVPAEWLVHLLDLIRRTPNLDWLLLTKRIGNWSSRIQAACDHIEGLYTGDAVSAVCSLDLITRLRDWQNGSPPQNVWIGATIVNQQEAERDIHKLLEVPAPVSFLSMEPLLGPVNLTELPYRFNGFTDQVVKTLNALTGNITVHDPVFGRGGWIPGIDWVIVGGESGPGARPMHADWARSIRDQCEEVAVPFLFKQWGEFRPNWFTNEHGEKDGPEWMDRMGKKMAGRELDGRTWDERPDPAQ